MTDRNVLGGELEPCGTDPVTGWFRDGSCRTDDRDRGSHTVCAVMSEEFLEHQASIGNDLTTPMPQYRFPGLKPAIDEERHARALRSHREARGSTGRMGGECG